jgi:SAM-dependent methyltransferase
MVHQQMLQEPGKLLLGEPQPQVVEAQGLLELDRIQRMLGLLAWCGSRAVLPKSFKCMVLSLAYSSIVFTMAELLEVSKSETSTRKAVQENRGDVMDNRPHIDAEKIVEGIRETTWKRRQESSLEELASMPRNGQGAIDLTPLHSCYDIYNVHFTSHRKILGWPIVFVKKLLRKLLTPILERQLTYNTVNAHLLSALWERDEVMGQQQGAALQALQVEMTEQQEAALQRLRAEITEQQGAALQALQVEMTEQQRVALQGLRTEITEQIEQMGLQRAAAFQAFREVVVGQVERLGQQQSTAMDVLRETVMGQVERLGQQQATAMDVLRETIMRQVEQLGQQLHNELAARDARIIQQKTQLIRQERRITMLLEEARKRLPAPFNQEQLQVMRAEGERSLEAFYVSFEDQFRGTREDIKERCRVYLPLLKEAGIGTDEMPILDLGCGRGEWLELLREEGLRARGLDLNSILVEDCRERELEVMEGDIITYLHTLPDASMGAITGFHIIEHLPFDVLIDVLDETVRVLKSGGLAIFETPNPQNVLVGSCNFYFDPTHLHPLPSLTMQFLAEARGLCKVEILNLHPPEVSPLRETTEVAKRFNEYFYGPMDYAIVGRRV